MPGRITREAPKGLLHHRRTTGDEFWKKKLRDAEELKTRQAEYNEAVPTNTKVIFYESMSGARMMDSPYALFTHIFDDPAFRDFHHVWSVRSQDLVPDELKDETRVTFVTRNTDAHMYFLALAGYIIGNSLLPDHFVRKPDQKYLNTWHGIAYKALGRTEDSPLGAAGSVYNLLQATHVLTPCPFMTETQLSRFSLRGVFSGSMAEIGYPRQDLTLNMPQEQSNQIRKVLELDPDKKTVLYAPTWRGNKGTARFDADQLEKDIDSLTKLDANVVFQAHHIMLRHIKNVDYGNIIVPPPSIVTNELLAVVDLLISDYSSIFFDFLATNKPIVHYLYDYDAYEEERGLLLDKSELPGPIVTTSDELIATVNDLTADTFSPDEKYRQAQSKFVPHDDGYASDRTIRWFFHGDTGNTKLIETRKRPSILFWGARLDKGKKTRDFLESVRIAAEAGDKDVTLFVAHSVKSNETAMEQIRKLGLSVSVVARNNYEMAMTTAERHARSPEDASRDARQEQRTTPFWERLTSVFRRTRKSDERPDSLLSDMYKREYRRVFGDSLFDEVVMFPGASHFWKKLAEHAHK